MRNFFLFFSSFFFFLLFKNSDSTVSRRLLQPHASSRSLCSSPSWASCHPSGVTDSSACRMLFSFFRVFSPLSLPTHTSLFLASFCLFGGAGLKHHSPKKAFLSGRPLPSYPRSLGPFAVWRLVSIPFALRQKVDRL